MLDSWFANGIFGASIINTSSSCVNIASSNFVVWRLYTAVLGQQGGLLAKLLAWLPMAIQAGCLSRPCDLSLLGSQLLLWSPGPSPLPDNRLLGSSMCRIHGEEECFGLLFFWVLFLALGIELQGAVLAYYIPRTRTWDPLSSTSQIARITVLCHCTWQE